MLGLLVVTHGRLAEVLVEAATTIVGEVESLEAVSIGWDDDVTEARKRVEDAVHRLGGDDGVLILTDMFGGTPTNIALSLLENGRVEVVTGVNLPMIIKFTDIRERVVLSDVAISIAAEGRRAIDVASALLEGENPGVAQSEE